MFPLHHTHPSPPPLVGEMDGEAEEDINVPLDAEMHAAIVSEDAKRLESLVGPNADNRPTQPFPGDQWFASLDSAESSARRHGYCYLCTVDPEGDEETMENEYRKTMEKWVASADKYNLESVCKAIKSIYDEHVRPHTNKQYTLITIREHIQNHDKLQPLLLVRRNIQLTQRIQDYWAGKLLYKSEEGEGEPELNEKAEAKIKTYVKQMTDLVKLYVALESHRR